MAVATGTSIPRFARTLQGISTEDGLRKAVLEREHPDYSAHKVAWEILLDAFEATGGFLDGGYLWPYPREEEPQFRERQQMARYHNYLETLVDLYVRQVFTQGVKRDSSDPAYNEWIEDVDGAGTPIDDYMRKFAAMSLVGGHSGTLCDKTREEPTGPRKVDETARVFLTLFPNTSIVDWRFRMNRLVGVKLVEAAPPTELVAVEEASTQQWLLWDEEGWARFDTEAELIEGDLTLALGRVPMVILRPKASQISLMRGRPIVPNANVIRALFNRCSEEDQVLRDQAFSVLTVSVPPEGDVEQAKANLGAVVGTAKALVVKGTIDYKTPSMDVPQAIRDNMSFLVQEIYRAAHLRFKRDSLDAESAEAIRLQYTELNEMLQGLGKALAQAEREIARCYYAWTEATQEAAEQAFEAADPRAEYPKEFFLDALISDLEAWAAAIEMDLGLSMTKRIKKRAVRRIEPDMDPKDLKAIDDEIDAMEEEPEPTPSDFGQDAEGGAAPARPGTSATLRITAEGPRGET
jgi:hypothetical protein